jgi:hypothetical protein
MPPATSRHSSKDDGPWDGRPRPPRQGPRRPADCQSAAFRSGLAIQRLTRFCYQYATAAMTPMRRSHQTHHSPADRARPRNGGRQIAAIEDRVERAQDPSRNTRRGSRELIIEGSLRFSSTHNSGLPKPSPRSLRRRTSGRGLAMSTSLRRDADHERRAARGA